MVNYLKSLKLVKGSAAAEGDYINRLGHLDRKTVFIKRVFICVVVLVLAGIELIFFTVAAVFGIQYENNIDNALKFLVVAKKSRTFFSFSCSANDQVYKSWEGA